MSVTRASACRRIAATFGAGTPVDGLGVLASVEVADMNLHRALNLAAFQAESDATRRSASWLIAKRQADEDGELRQEDEDAE